MPRHRRGWAMEESPGREDRHSPITVTILEPALLILLKEQPRHGYTLLTELDALGMSTLHPSVVYRMLREMEKLEWVSSGWDMDQTQGPPRRIYHLTTSGEQTLQNWKQELEKNRALIQQLIERI